MDRYRQARRDRRTGPRPQGGVARRWNAFLNALVFCIWNFPADKDDGEDGKIVLKIVLNMLKPTGK